MESLRTVRLAAAATLLAAAVLGDKGMREAPGQLPEPMNLETILVQKTPGGTGKHRVPVELLLGGLPDKLRPLAIKASPIGYVQPDAPPLLLVYGGADDQVPAAQGPEIAEAYCKKGASVELVVIEEVEHKSLLKFDERRRDLLGRFLSKELLSIDPPGAAVDDGQ